MYTPDFNSMIDRQEMVDFMKRYAFAVLITAKNGIPRASHLPFCVSETNGELRLTAHFAKANTHWQELEDHPVLALFSGPHAYISPISYEEGPNVPTWNYLAVHALGHCKIALDTAETLRILEEIIGQHEIPFQQEWDAYPEAYRMGMVRGVVAFTMTVTDLQGKKKLSQNRTPNEQRRIVEVLSKSEDSLVRDLAAYMAIGRADTPQEQG